MLGRRRPARSAWQIPCILDGCAVVKTAKLMNHVAIVPADYANTEHAAAVVAMLDSYARDPQGGAAPLSEFARSHLVAALAARPNAYSVLAFDAAQPVGLVNCMEGFSTFACQPLVNVHDVVVLASHRGMRIAERMLEVAERLARDRGACKLTLEVLSGNTGANKLYARLGFVQYQLDPQMGSAMFLQKWLE